MVHGGGCRCFGVRRKEGGSDGSERDDTINSQAGGVEVVFLFCEGENFFVLSFLFCEYSLGGYNDMTAGEGERCVAR